jgi:DNA topoisomerase VI subunit A
MSGSKNMSYDSASLTTPDIKWLGLRPSDLDKFDLPGKVAYYILNGLFPYKNVANFLELLVCRTMPFRYD